MRVNKIFCDWDKADLTDEDNFITINGKIDYCNEVCKKLNQERCATKTGHKNSVKDQVQGECLDCGIAYEVPGL